MTAESGPISPLCAILLLLFGCVELSLLTLKFNNLIRMRFVFVLRFLYQMFLKYTVFFFLFCFGLDMFSKFFQYGEISCVISLNIYFVLLVGLFSSAARSIPTINCLFL